jgi:hypothetical protein
MVWWGSYYIILRYTQHIIILIRLHWKETKLLSVNRVQEELLFHFNFIRNVWCAYLIRPPLRKSLSLRHCKWKVFTLLHKLILLKLQNYVLKIIILDESIFIVVVKVVVPSYETIWFIFKYHFECIMHLVLPKLDAGTIEGLKMAVRYIKWKSTVLLFSSNRAFVFGLNEILCDQ